MNKQLIGKISHFFAKIGVAVIDLTAPLKVGDRISIERDGQVIEQVVTSMQVEHKNIQEAKPGMSIGMKVDGITKDGAQVYKVTG